MSRLATVIAIILLCCIAGTATAATVNPWDFSVVSLGNLGSAGSPYGSDIQGSAAVVGNAYVFGFSLNGQNAGQPTGYSLYAGGQVHINGGQINNGGVEAGGNVTVDNATIEGDIHSGGDLHGSSGTITGNAILAGVNHGAPNQLTIDGQVHQHQSYTPSFDVSALPALFQNASANYAALTADTSYINSYGDVSITLASSGVHSVTLPAGFFASGSSVYEVDVHGAADSWLVVNLPDNTLSTKYITFTYNDGIA